MAFPDGGDWHNILKQTPQSLRLTELSYTLSNVPHKASIQPHCSISVASWLFLPAGGFMLTPLSSRCCPFLCEEKGKSISSLSMSKNDDIDWPQKGARNLLCSLLKVLEQNRDNTQKCFSCLLHMWAVWKLMVIKGNHYRRKMARNSTMVLLKWGQKWSGNCSGSEKQRKNLLVINLWKTVQKSLEGKEVTTFLSSPPD